MTIRIGTSGWSYDHWVDVLYPPKTPAARRLARYVEVFDTVELNASFYRWPKDSTFSGWRERLPPGFTMTIKAHRGLTHYRRLSSPEPWIERFERCWQLLGDRHGVLLVQVHPELQRDESSMARLEVFLARLPAAIRVAVELRHPSWDDPAVYETLHRHRAAYVVMSGAGLACIPKATTDFVYIRMHGPDSEAIYAGSYSDDQLRVWADRIAEWDRAGKDVWMYFNNDLGGHAVRNALRLRELVS
ncbi:sensor histidine kinase [Mycobacterium sp. 1100029.7]|nr:sensor histidine kinase [Mycobacterium sp. 1100029.7]